MSFNPENKAHKELFEHVVAGTTTKTEVAQLEKGICNDWTQSQLEEEYSAKKVDEFFAKLGKFQKGMDVSNIAIFGEKSTGLELFYKDEDTNTWTQSNDVLEHIVYNLRKRATPNDVKLVIDFAKHDVNSNALRFNSYRTQCVPVGSQWFDSESGKLLDEQTGEGINMFGFNRNIELMPVFHVKDCKSYLVTTLRDALGCEQLNYVLNCIAYNLFDLNIVDRVFIIIIGASRSGKGTLVEALKRVGICSQTDFGSDLNSTQEYRELTVKAMSSFPVASANEVNTLNYTMAKSLCSDPSASFNRKYQTSVSVPMRAIVLATANTLPKCAISGVANKLIIVRTNKSYLNSQNPHYWEDVEAEGYDEFISLILNKACQIAKSGWTPAKRPKEIEASVEEAKCFYMPYDAFFEHWILDDTETSLQEAYAQGLYFANPSSTDWKQARHASVYASHNRVKGNPEGHYGISYNNFISRFVGLNNIPYRKANGMYVRGHFPTELIDKLVEKSASFEDECKPNKKFEEVEDE